MLANVFSHPPEVSSTPFTSRGYSEPRRGCQYPSKASAGPWQFKKILLLVSLWNWNWLLNALGGLVKHPLEHLSPSEGTQTWSGNKWICGYMSSLPLFLQGRQCGIASSSHRQNNSLKSVRLRIVSIHNRECEFTELGVTQNWECEFTAETRNLSKSSCM